jgi:hypothetical protein
MTACSKVGNNRPLLTVASPPPVPVAHGATVTFTGEELIALFDAACFAGAYQRPAAGAANIGITPDGIIRQAAALDAARAKIAVALGPSGQEVAQHA